MTRTSTMLRRCRVLVCQGKFGIGDQQIAKLEHSIELPMVRSILLIGGLAVSSALMMGTAPAKRNMPITMADILDTAQGLQGPEIFWGPDGVGLGYEESDIKGYDGFNKFVEAVQQHGLTATLKGPGPFTVFAPTNEVLAEYIINGGQITADLLKYHVVQGIVTTSAFSSANLMTLQGKSLTYRRMYRKDFIDDATPGVKSEGPSKSASWPSDIMCDNGVLHSCNQVLIPGWTPSS
ncbi:hypothetical protein AB1Y20_020561 [Prymnesium parvum]|uniref:FAS1 domain-containing protein n=1 Tax=Prymnesium parvum TaxID=97485 RepID=A0AB34JXS5_PRYPA